MKTVMALTEKTIGDLLNAVQSIKHPIDVIELRLDYLEQLSIIGLKSALTQIPYPVIVTLRPASQGGHYAGSEEDRLQLLQELADVQSAYLDIEFSLNPATIKVQPATQLIRSYHNFAETPEDLEAILSDMQHPDVAIYKIVTQANNTLDCLRMLHFLKRHQETALVAHCMGPLGLPSRIMGAILGNAFTYISLPGSDSPAPELGMLMNITHVDQLNPDTQVYALLGDPVEHSIGHLFHNQQFSERGINAVYVKLQVAESELPHFFELVQTLPFHGFSVTMPLKTTVMAFSDVLEPNCEAIGAANTLALRNGQWHGSNTDGLGTLDVIEERCAVDGAHVLVLGAGGAAKAVAYECSQKNPASLTILNRTLSNAQALAEKLNANTFDFRDFHSNTQQFDIVVNTIPNPQETIIDATKPFVSSETVLINLDYSAPENPFSVLDCVVIDGQEMFERQAIRQLRYWFPG